ncbi:hypothetical protein MLD38_031515 [Melastoma candidum]|uniref:Uncharacterized protein n=1 Tax=Melastoma candidum TaxID=119954 RepID=A0ACB9MRG5_9MYRT|nr:hypothetical protein MLD38_031515 [Melastoma candidum]
MDDEGSSGSRDDWKMIDGHDGHPAGNPSISGQKKRGRKAHGDAIVDAMLEIAAASRMRANAILRNEYHFSISKCIKLLDEMHGVDQNIYLHALELFENSTARECVNCVTFWVSFMKGTKRWGNMVLSKNWKLKQEMVWEGSSESFCNRKTIPG